MFAFVLNNNYSMAIICNYVSQDSQVDRPLS